MQSTQLVQMMTRALLGDVLKSDLRSMQKQILLTEKRKLETILQQVKRDGIKNVRKANKVLKMLSGEITPYSELKVPTAPDLLVSYTEALDDLISAYTGRNAAKVKFLKKMKKPLAEQRDNMLQACSEARPEHFLLLTKEFLERWHGCAEYNLKVGSFVSDSLAASTYEDLLVTTTTYLVFLDYARSYADFCEQGLPLFQFKQELDTIVTPSRKATAMHINFANTGVYPEEVCAANKLSLERQYKRYSYIVGLQQDLTRRYIAKIILHNKEKIQAIYAENPTVSNRLLVSTVASRIREKCETRLFGAVQKLFDTYALHNAAWLSKNAYNGSPLHALISQNAPITETTRIKTFHADFMLNLKYVLLHNKNLKHIIAPPSMHARVLKTAQTTAAGLAETHTIDLEQITTDGLIESMDMDYEDTTSAFQRKQILHKDITVFGEYIVTERNFLTFQTQFPVIQIERTLAGAEIVGLNEQAFRLGFRLHCVLTRSEKVNADEIDKFLKTGAADDLCSTRFRMVRLGTQKQDAHDENKQMLEEVLSDVKMDMLDDIFNEMNQI